MKKEIRRCAQCRELIHRDLMHRLRLRPDGSLTLWKDGIGRSLYLCHTEKCLKIASRNKSLLRYLPGITPEVWRDFCEKLLSH